MQRILGKEMQKETRTKTEKEMKARVENDMKARRKNAKEKKKLTNKTTKKKPKKKPKKNTKKKEHKVERLPEDIAWDVYEMLNGKGVAVLPSIIDAELCAEIAADIHTRVMGVEQANFGVKGYWLRKDVGPSLNVGNVYSKLIGSLATLFADVLEAELGPDPELFELSNMVAYPGAAMQDPHSDVTAIDGTDEDLTDEERYYPTCIPAHSKDSSMGVCFVFKNCGLVPRRVAVAFNEATMASYPVFMLTCAIPI